RRAGHEGDKVNQLDAGAMDCRTAFQSVRASKPDGLKNRPTVSLPRWTQLPNLLTLLFLLLLLAIYWRPFADLDFAWQVRTGDEIVHTGKLRVEDSFTYTIAGKQLPDFEWLYEVFLWGVWSVAGYGGLHLLKTLFVLTPLLLVGWRLRREGIGWHAV